MSVCVCVCVFMHECVFVSACTHCLLCAYLCARARVCLCVCVHACIICSVHTHLCAVHVQMVSELEGQVAELREELVQANQLRKQQLVELGLLREEEKQKMQRDHEAEVGQG